MTQPHPLALLGYGGLICFLSCTCAAFPKGGRSFCSLGLSWGFGFIRAAVGNTTPGPVAGLVPEAPGLRTNSREAQLVWLPASSASRTASVQSGPKFRRPGARAVKSPTGPSSMGPSASHSCS